MFAYVVCHLLNHAFAVVSIEAANDARVFFVSPWTNPTGTVVLTVAALTHIGLALWTTYARRSPLLSGLGPVEIQDSQTVLFMIQASFWRRLE